MKNFLFVVVLFLLNFNSFADPGCLVGNTFYTNYLGPVKTTNGSFAGSKEVFNSQGQSYALNYQNYDVCNTVRANNYPNLRGGDLCFALAPSTYGSYPNGVTSGYPRGNGTLQDFQISCVNLPLDDYIGFIVLAIGGLGAFYISKSGLASV